MSLKFGAFSSTNGIYLWTLFHIDSKTRCTHICTRANRNKEKKRRRKKGENKGAYFLKLRHLYELCKLCSGKYSKHPIKARQKTHVYVEAHANAITAAVHKRVLLVKRERICESGTINCDRSIHSMKHVYLVRKRGHMQTHIWEHIPTGHANVHITLDESPVWCSLNVLLRFRM